MNLAATLGLNPANFLAGLGQAGAAVSGFKASLGPVALILGAFTAGLGAAAIAAGTLKSAVDAAAEMETLEGSFATLLGGATAAKQRMQELADFANTTPFELTGVANASKLLQAFTGPALATGAGLRLVGDAAAAVGQPLEAVSMWFGRLYAGLKDGQPLGEPIQNLTQLGLISGETRKALMALQGQSLDNAKVMEVLGQAFGQNSGAMARLAATYDGKLSTMGDAWNKVKVTLGEPIRDALKPFIDLATTQLDGLVDSARGVGRRIAEVLQTGFSIITGGDLSGFLATALIAGTKEWASSMIDTITRPFRVGVAALAAGLDSVANVFGTSLDAVLLRAKITMKELLVQALDFTSVMRGGKGAPDKLQISLKDDVLKLHEMEKRDATGEADFGANFTKWMEKLRQGLNPLADGDPFAELRRQWDIYLADAKKRMEAAGQVGPDRPVAAPTNALAGLGGRVREDVGDRLARIGGFIGGAGGPALDYARRTAVAAEGQLRKLDTLISRAAAPTGSAAAWA